MLDRNKNESHFDEFGLAGEKTLKKEQKRESSPVQSVFAQIPGRDPSRKLRAMPSFLARFAGRALGLC